MFSHQTEHPSLISGHGDQALTHLTSHNVSLHCMVNAARVVAALNPGLHQTATAGELFMTCSWQTNTYPKCTSGKLLASASGKGSM